VNISAGGSYDGFALSGTMCLSSVNIFYGGSYDGFSLSRVECSSTIFSGGANDGFAMGYIACFGIYSGGMHQGFSQNNTACVAAQNVFKGGSSDGFTQNVLSCASSVNIFSGFSYNGFSIVRIGCTPGGGISLPIRLVDFKATCENKKVIISWRTANEINNDYFMVERSSDGINFQILGVVEGAGNSNQALNYSFVDAEPLDVTAFYRIRQTDFDGQSEYFNVVASTCIAQEGRFSIYPNPNNGHFFIEGCPLNTSLEITNPVGEKIYDSKIREKKTEIVLVNLSNGIYFIHLNMGNEMITKKIFIVQ